MTVRNALIALLVLNILAFAWIRWVDTGSQLPAAASTAITVPAAKPEPAPVAAAADAMSDAAENSPRCVSVGPFRDTAETTQAIQTFRDAGYDPRSRTQSAEIADGFWVHVDAIKSVTEQRRMLAAIKRAGIDDATAMPAQPDTNYRLSVGVFSDRDRAERRAQRVRALDIEAKVEPHARSATFYWLDMAQRAGDESLRLDVLNGSGASSGGLTITGCPAATSAPG